MTLCFESPWRCFNVRCLFSCSFQTKVILYQSSCLVGCWPSDGRTNSRYFSLSLFLCVYFLALNTGLHASLKLNQIRTKNFAMIAAVYDTFVKGFVSLPFFSANVTVCFLSVVYFSNSLFLLLFYLFLPLIFFSSRGRDRDGRLCFSTVICCVLVIYNLYYYISWMWFAASCITSSLSRLCFMHTIYCFRYISCFKTFVFQVYDILFHVYKVSGGILSHLHNQSLFYCAFSRWYSYLYAV